MWKSASTRRFLDVEEFASRQACFSGLVEPVQMPRLLEVAASTPSAIAYRIEFTRDASGRPRMRGRVEGMLPLICQRCLEELEWPIETGFESLAIGSEHEKTRGLDAVVCSGGRLDLESVIEDELLLALPNSPAHAYGSCEPPPIRDASEQPALRRTNPFTALRALHSHRGRERSN